MLFRFEDPGARLEMPGIGKPPSRPVAVAIPVKDEAERLPDCLAALAAQRDKFGGPIAPNSFSIVLFANNCTDDSASLARSMRGRLGLDLRVIEASLPPSEAHAGNARRAAMDYADSCLASTGERNGVILTTDADSRVPPLWIANNLAAFDAGAHAVLGNVDLDEEGALLPEALHQRGKLEGEYETLLTELSARLDPVDFNPWPHHATISGASLAVTRKAYLRAGGLPRVPLGEDKAFVAELFRCDARIRFSPDIVVTTSGRLKGRAPGGVADTLRLRCADLEAMCDEALEPFRISMKRAKWRGRLRRLFAVRALGCGREWAETLGVSASDARRACQAPTFGAAWSAIEAASSLLVRRSLTPAELPDQIAGARRALKRLRNDVLSTSENVEPELGITVPTSDDRGLPHSADELLDGLVAR
jgi:hypothetical protein